MADNGIPPELIDALREFTDQLTRTNRTFDDYITDIDRLAVANANAEKRAAAARQKAIDDFGEHLKNAGLGLLNLSKSMTTPQGAFQAMGEVTANLVKGIADTVGSMTKFGSVIKGLGTVGAEAIKFLTAETGKAFATFGKLSQTGVVESFAGMREASRETRLTFEQLSNVFAKNSESLAIFGGSAVQGSKDLQKIISINNKAALNMQKMGVGFDEFAEIQATYIANLTRTGGARAKTDAQLAEGARDYAEQLVVLSRLTGQSREALQKRETELANSARLQAKLRDLELKGRGEEAARIKLWLDSVPVDQVSKWTEYFAAPGKYGAVIGKESAGLAVNLSAMGININTFGEQIQSGQKTTVQGLDTLKSGFDQYHRQVGDQVMLGDKLFGDFYLGMSKLGEQGARTGQSFEGSEKNIKEGVENQKKLTDSTAEVARKSQELAVKIGLFATDTERLMAVNAKIADAMDKFLETLDKAVKGDYSGAVGGIGGILSKLDVSDIILGALGLKGLMKGGGLPGTGGTVPRGTGGTVPPGTGGAGGAAGAAGRMSMLSRLGYVGAVGAAGYAVGSSIFKPGIDKLVEMGTGQKDITLGSWLYDKLNPEEKKQLQTPIATPATAPTAPTSVPTAPTTAPTTPAAAPTAPTTAPATPAAPPVAEKPKARPPVETSISTPAAPVDQKKESRPSDPSKILDFIGKKESGGDYDILVGGKKSINGTPVKITDMTVAQVLDLQSKMKASGFESTAVGKYQIIRNTLLGSMKIAGVKSDDKFDKTTQDKLGLALLKTRGLDSYLSGALSPTQFADNLSKEWASLPYSTGKSYYAGVGSNKSLISRDDFINVLKAQNGAVVPPKAGGTLVQVAEAGQSEAIVPLPDGRTIPVTIKNSGEQTAAMRDMFEAMGEKLDSMISLLADSNKYSRNIAQNTILS